MGIECPGSTLRAEAPDVPQELVLGEDASRLARQGAEQSEFLVRQLHLPVADGDAARGRIHGQVAEANRSAPGTRPPRLTRDR